jgi:hypothetical protein
MAGIRSIFQTDRKGELERATKLASNGLPVPSLVLHSSDLFELGFRSSRVNFRRLSGPPRLARSAYPQVRKRVIHVIVVLRVSIPYGREAKSCLTF